MSIIQMIIAREQPRMVASRAAEILQLEAQKGCLNAIVPGPVELEPPYNPPEQWLYITPENQLYFSLVDQSNTEQQVRHTAWIPPDHELDWVRAERFVKILDDASHRIGFEIAGNEKDITFSFTTHPEDSDLIVAAVKGEYATCDISTTENSGIQGVVSFYDMVPPPPYHHLLTRYRMFDPSPFESFILSLARLPETAHGFVQVLLQPARNNWHRNVEVLTNLEYRVKGISDTAAAYQRMQQLPSADLHGMAQDVSFKAHTDKPFFFAAVRVGIVSNEHLVSSRALASFTHIYRHGCQPLQSLTDDDYRQYAIPTPFNEMFGKGLIFHPGFLVNSEELAGLVHIPSTAQLKELEVPIKFLETLTIRKKGAHLRAGTKIGTYDRAGTAETVCIPHELRLRSTHIIGKPDMGKTCLIQNMIVDDINAGHGVGLIDPHGDCVDELLHLIPEDKVPETIYLELGNPDWIPLFNPLAPIPGYDLSRLANNLVTALKSYIDETGWGDRLENILRFGFHALLQVGDMTLLDLYKLLRPKMTTSSDRNRIKKLILNSIQDETALEFWEHDFDLYRHEELLPPKNKLSKLIFCGPVADMLIQPENRINFREIIDTGKIFLVNLSKLEAEHQGIIGSFLLTLFHEAAVSRSAIPTTCRKPFFLYCDEAHMMTSSKLENMLAEIRKYGVGLTLVHQVMSQFSFKQQDALASTGTRIVFNVDASDAEKLVKDMQGKVTPEEIFELEQRQIIARIDTSVVRLKTLDLLTAPSRSFKNLIIHNSRMKYYHEKNHHRTAIALSGDGEYCTPSGVLDQTVPTDHLYEEFI